MADLLYFLFDLLLGKSISRSRKRKAVRPAFESLKVRIIHNNAVENLPVELHRLRTFLIAEELTKHRNIRGFYSKWLTHINVAAGVPVTSAYTGQEVRELKHELGQIEL